MSSLEKINTDLTDIQEFSKTVIDKETDENVTSFAKETITNFNKMVDHVEAFRTRKKVDSAAFETEYKKIRNSFGKKGDYEQLSLASSKSDEAKLKELRETILQRNPDECFYDYQKINNFKMLNRLIWK